jgi:hypothetical protein
MGEGRHLMLIQINSFVLSTTGGASVTSQRLAGELLETQRDNTTSNTPISSLFCQHQMDDYYARLQERGHPAVWGHTPRPYRMWSGEAIMAGTAVPSRNTPPDEQYALKPMEEGYYMNRLNNREVSNSQLVSER